MVTAHDLEAEGLPSASGFDSEFRCLGKRALCATLLKVEDTAIQQRGQRIHQALADFTFDALAETDKRTASRIAYLESQIVHTYNFEGAEVYFEERHWDYDDAFNKTWSGRIDRYDWQPHARRLLLLDNKTGWAIGVPIDQSWQLRSEAALLCFERDADEVVTGLIHPHHSETPFEIAVYTRDQCQEFLDTVRWHVNVIQLPDQPRTPGRIQCRWCPAKPVCPEFLAQQAELAQRVSDQNDTEGMAALLALSPQARGIDVDGLKELEKGIKARLELYRRLIMENPDAINGWVLRRIWKRVITDEGKAMELVGDTFGDDVLAAATKFSLSALENELAKQMPKRDAIERVERLLGGVIKRKSPEYQLREARSV
jgi:hypothetical protein